MSTFVFMVNKRGLKDEKVHACLVVQFYPWFKFYFPLFWGMVMYELKTKGNK